MRVFSRDELAGMAVLGTSGLISAISLLWLASNRIDGMSPSFVTAVLLAIQWHLLGLTLAKFGIDYAVFAIVSRANDVTFRARDALLVPILPCAAVFLAASFALFPPVAAVLLTAAVVLDTLATIEAAELNARRRFVASAIGNLLNYPVFVVCCVILASYKDITLRDALLSLVATRAMRYAWVHWRATRGHPQARPFTIAVKGWIGLQGALNLLVFRSDQVLLAVLLFAGAGTLSTNANLSLFVFLSRFPEIATGILVLVGTVVFPRRHLEERSSRNGAATLRYYAALSLVVAMAGAIALVATAPLFAGPAPTWSWWLPFVIHIGLVLPANLVTYSMQSQGYLAGLLRNYATGIAAGLLLAVWAVAARDLLIMAWVIPVQLAVFLAVSFFQGWGERMRVFEPTESGARAG